MNKLALILILAISAQGFAFGDSDTYCALDDSKWFGVEADADEVVLKHCQDGDIVASLRNRYVPYRAAEICKMGTIVTFNVGFLCEYRKKHRTQTPKSRRGIENEIKSQRE